MGDAGRGPDQTREADLTGPRGADPDRERDTAVEPRGAAARGPAHSPDHSPGWLRAMVVGGIAVDVVLVAAVVTFLLPRSVGDVVFRTPLLILVLIGGTAGVLWTITRPGRADR